MCWSAGVLHRHNLVPDLRVVTREERATVNDHVNLIGARGDCVFRLFDLQVKPGPPARKRRSDRGNLHATPCERLLCNGDKVRVATEGSHGRNVSVAWVRACRFCGELTDLPWRVLPLQCGEITHADRKPQRPDLGRLLD